MDRYFYIIEQDENGNKVIHIQGNLYFCDGGYCHSEWKFLYFNIDEAKHMIEDDTFFSVLDVKVDYLTDIASSETAYAIADNYFDGETGKRLDICDITQETPCGCYYFERK